MNGNTIGDRIRALRLAKGETPAELGKALNVSRQHVEFWEKNERDLKTQYTVALANHFNVTCDYILRGIDAENVSIHEAIGLSNEAIKKLKFVTQGLSGQEPLGEFAAIVLNDILTSSAFTDLIINAANFQHTEAIYSDVLRLYDKDDPEGEAFIAFSEPFESEFREKIENSDYGKYFDKEKFLLIPLSVLAQEEHKDNCRDQMQRLLDIALKTNEIRKLEWADRQADADRD